jgi:hypothetical protein
MRYRTVLLPALLVGLAAAGRTRADVVRYHYPPAGPGCQTVLSPGPGGPVGERQPWRGSARRDPVGPPPQPTHLVTFRHPYTGGLVTVPMTLPADSTPRIEHVGDRVVFNYGSYTVEAEFFADGSVDVIYNGGLFRRAF